jgi:hypothetical protein
MSTVASKLAEAGRTPVLVCGFSKHSSDRMAWKIPGTSIQIERWVKRSLGNVAKSTRATRWVVFETKANRLSLSRVGSSPMKTTWPRGSSNTSTQLCVVSFSSPRRDHG